ncbi:hypothetical protein FIBSPDRAFT_1035853 [Athelia psychrophila]|uniref:Uncharacterized protein n=1 Tax=Athelia psychrophila TaxID=1759441 RepID=A0A166WLS8_9AGAM|nr:hypothetical protein FIBSPDRAFT_1035853 [Fibularhizoctonia sp. CBS 109695]
MGNTEHDSGRGRSSTKSQRHSRRSPSTDSPSISRSRSRSPRPKKTHTPQTDKRRAPDPSDEENDIPSTPRPKKKSKSSPPSQRPRKAKRSADVRDQLVVDKGRMYGRWVDMWGTIKTVVEEGIARDYEVDDECYTNDQNRRAKIYRALVDFIPRIEEMLDDPHSSTIIASDLEFGRSGARSTDVSSFKAAINRWATFDPPYDHSHKAYMGFRHQMCGQLLCPASMDWSNPEIKLGLANDTIKAQPDDFPRFLYLDGQVSDDDVFQGFLKGDLLVKGYMHLMRAPSLATSGGMGESGNRRGNAALHDIQNTNMRSIVYTAVLIRFALSSQANFTIGGSPGKWPYGQLYREIMEVCEMMPSAQRRDLLIWWDERIFGDATAAKEECSVLGAAHVTMASRMKAQLAAAAGEAQAALGNITNAG